MAKKKSKPYTKKKFKRAVKQTAYLTNTEDGIIFDELSELARNARNYMYSRLAGINSYFSLQSGDRKIRDTWSKDKRLIAQFKLPARFWKIILSEVVASLKSLWSNACRKIKEVAKENDNLTDDEKSYIRYVCSAPSLFGNVLLRQVIVRPKKIEQLVIREKYIHNMICRYARRYRGKTPYSYSKTIQIDADMYDYVREDGVTYIEISNHHKGKRVRLQCANQNVYRKNIKISYDRHVFTLTHMVESKQKQNWLEHNEVGIDKGYKTMLVSSSGNYYGEKLNDLLSKETERLNNKNKKRNPYYAIVRQFEEQGDFKKAQTIRQNNLGKIKYNRNKQKHDSTVKSMVNCELNKFIKQEKPSVVAIENLVFVSWDTKMPKHVKRKLSRWIKGYIDERLTFKCNLNGIIYEYVNPAYTSQECHVCGCLGERKTQEKFICVACGEFNADENAAKVIKKRRNDKEITLYTPYKKVKEFLQKRKQASLAFI